MIADQNKKLSQAARTPKDTSHRRENADNFSAKISSSQAQGKSKLQSSRNDAREVRSDPVKGSFEGLQHSSGTLLSQNDAGYDNKSLQTARYNKEILSHNNANFVFDKLQSDSNYSIIDNYSSTHAKDTSSFRMSSIVSNNMNFR